MAVVQVVVGILVRDGGVLLCRRKPGRRYELQWEFPGGKVEPGESSLDALRRELREELGVEPHGTRLFRTDRNVYPDGGVFEVEYFFIDGFAGEPENRDFHEIRWVRPADFDDFDMLEGNREVCSRLRESGLSATEQNNV